MADSPKFSGSNLIISDAGSIQWKDYSCSIYPSAVGTLKIDAPSVNLIGIITPVDLTITGNTIIGNTATDTLTITGTTLIGTSGAPITLTAGGNLLQTYQTNSATTGDVRNLYNKMILTGATGVSGDAVRAYALCTGKPLAIHGIHATAEVNAGTGVAGIAAGLRGTIASAGSLTLNAGTYAPLRLDSSLKSALNAAKSSWIYCEDLETSKIESLLNLAVVDTSTMYVAAGTGAGSAGVSTGGVAQKVLKIYVNGAACYIPVFTSNA